MVALHSCDFIFVVNKQRRKSSGSILRNMSSADLVDRNDLSEANHHSATVNGLPAYQQSIQNFLKRQLSNTTTVSHYDNRSTLLEADRDIDEIDLDEECNDSLYETSTGSNNEKNFQSPVYPALFLNDFMGTSDNEQLQQLNHDADIYDTMYGFNDEIYNFFGSTSVYEQEDEEDYFSLNKDVFQQGLALSGILHLK